MCARDSCRKQTVLRQEKWETQNSTPASLPNTVQHILPACLWSHCGRLQEHPTAMNGFVSRTSDTTSPQNRSKGEGHVPAGRSPEFQGAAPCSAMWDGSGGGQVSSLAHQCRSIWVKRLSLGWFYSQCGCLHGFLCKNLTFCSQTSKTDIASPSLSVLFPSPHYFFPFPILLLFPSNKSLVLAATIIFCTLL